MKVPRRPNVYFHIFRCRQRVKLGNGGTVKFKRKGVWEWGRVRFMYEVFIF